MPADPARSETPAGGEDGGGGLIRDGQILSVWVLSPGPHNRSARIGSAHRSTIEFALARQGSEVRLPGGSGAVELRLHFRDDRASRERAHELAGQALEESGLGMPVAILGPVNSSATCAVIEHLAAEEASLPVLTALSTAPILTHPPSDTPPAEEKPGRDSSDAARGSGESGPPSLDCRVEERSRNLFRFIFHDRDRMRWYASYLEKHLEGRDKEIVLLVEPDAYGLGLAASIAPYLESKGSVTTVECCSEDCGEIAKCLDGYHSDTIEKGEAFLFLGTLRRSRKMAEEIVDQRQEGREADYEFFFVGESPDLEELDVPRIVTIGNPVLDVDRAPTARVRERWQDLLDHFEAFTNLNRGEFQPTAYEAVWTLRQAIANVLRESDKRVTRAELREALLQELRTATFESLEPWRYIRFADGDLVHKPKAPIYLYERKDAGLERRRVDRRSAREWVSVGVPEATGFGLGGAVVELRRHNGSGRKVELSVGGRPFRPVDWQGEDVAKVSMRWLTPGSHEVRVQPVPAHPLGAKLVVNGPWWLLWAGVGSLLGVLLQFSRHRWDWSLTPRRSALNVVLGLSAGFLLTMLSFSAESVSAWLPRLQIVEVPLVNALLNGLIGGAAGPTLLMHAIRPYVGDLSHGREGAANPQPQGPMPPEPGAGWRRYELPPG